jgi:hypothetical protein
MYKNGEMGKNNVQKVWYISIKALSLHQKIQLNNSLRPGGNSNSAKNYEYQERDREGDHG